MTRAEIEAALSDIRAILRTPGLPNVERMLLHRDRKDLREELARLDDHLPKGPPE